MSPDHKSDSFMFRKDVLEENTNKIYSCRKKLQDKFEQAEHSTSEGDRSDRSILSALSVDDTRRLLRSGLEKLTKSLSTMRTTLGSFSQKFRTSTKRRQILEEGPMTPACATPHTYSRALLGRTPTKLYSPFSIESPYNSTTYNKENEPNGRH